MCVTSCCETSGSSVSALSSFHKNPKPDSRRTSLGTRPIAIMTCSVSAILPFSLESFFYFVFCILYFRSPSSLSILAGSHSFHSCPSPPRSFPSTNDRCDSETFAISISSMVRLVVFRRSAIRLFDNNGGESTLLFVSLYTTYLRRRGTNIDRLPLSLLRRN
ncbi:hypothetical protein H2248_007973 [Termitomyces sp. 'cryptogamus']|nr:hypothetical protein H2248_007973 [Termitomyces sp. 'cryptogamus']